MMKRHIGQQKRQTNEWNDKYIYDKKKKEYKLTPKQKYQQDN